MNWSQLNREIDSGALRNVYLFQGPEEYVKKSALEKMRARMLPPGLEMLNEAVFEGAEVQKLIEAAETLPVMSDKRLVVVRDPAILMPGKAKDEAAETERLCQWLTHVPPTCVTVFYLRGAADARKKSFKVLQKLEAIVQFDYLTDAEIAKWALGKLKPLGKSIDMTAVTLITFLSGRALTSLEGELMKLAAYTGERTEITVADVRKIVQPSLESGVFEMIDRLMEKKCDAAFAILANLLEMGESRAGVLAMLTRQIRLLTHMRLQREAGEALPKAEAALGVSGFVGKRLWEQCAAYRSEVLEEEYHHAVAADYAFKSGRMTEEEALSRTMLELANLPRSR